MSLRACFALWLRYCVHLFMLTESGKQQLFPAYETFSSRSALGRAFDPESLSLTRWRDLAYLISKHSSNRANRRSRLLRVLRESAKMTLIPYCYKSDSVLSRVPFHTLMKQAHCASYRQSC